MSARCLLAMFICLAAAVPGAAQTLLQASDFTYLGAYTIALNGNDSTYTQGLTTRHVNGELRFLTVLHGGRLAEFRLPPGFGEVHTPLRTWDLSRTRALDDFIGIWFEEARQRLWITSATDYTDRFEEAHIVTMTLNDDGTVGDVHRVSLKGIPERRVYGGCQPSPVKGYPYVCGWGGYTSTVMSAGGASVGPTMYAIPDPASVPDGKSLSVKVILDAADYQSNRGVRATLPLNYYDGGDPRPNPPTPPSAPPARGADWLSPNKQGLGWMVMSDSYYGTGMWIDTGAKRGFVLVASLCGGKCFYMSSSVWSETRVFEWHIFDPATLGTGRLRRPSSMTPFTLPGRSPEPMDGNTPVRNVGAAAYADGRIFLWSCGGDGTVYQYACGLFTYAVTGSPQPALTR